MTTLRFHPEARAELRAAVRHYHERDPQLARDLVAELRAVVDRILKFPGSGSPRKRLRHAVLDRFPFAVVYSTVEDDVYVIALMHQRREPGYWRERDDFSE